MAPLARILAPPASVEKRAKRQIRGMKSSATRSLVRNARLSVAAAVLAAASLVSGAARAESAAPAPTAEAPNGPNAAAAPYHLGAHAELDVGTLLALKQSAAFAGGVVYGPFRAGLSYATFLSNKSLGGVPDGFSLRANYIVGINASYFIARHSDDGFYVQAMFHIKQQGVTNLDNGAHRDLNSLAAGLELGYVWKVHRGLYVAPRVGALYYVKKPQGSANEPIDVGGRDYDNSRHKHFDTYFIPTLSVGYSW